MIRNDIAAWRVEFNGAVLIHEIPLEQKYETLDSVSEAYSSDIYTTFRTYKHDYALLLDKHFDRLEESAKLVNGDLCIPRNLLRQALRQILSSFPPDQDVRIRIALNLKEGSYFISAEPLKLLPSSAYEKGVSVITYPLERQNPHAKTSEFILTAAHLKQTMPPNIHEIIMVDKHGYLLEGLSSNFWGIINGIIYTEKDRVLGGITRSAVIELCEKENIPLSFASIHIKELQNLSEAFITSSSRGVLPVCSIDDHKVGMGTPGDITKLLAERYQEFVNREIKKI